MFVLIYLFTLILLIPQQIIVVVVYLFVDICYHFVVYFPAVQGPHGPDHDGIQPISFSAANRRGAKLSPGTGKVLGPTNVLDPS